jgi:hypothetical protein
MKSSQGQGSPANRLNPVDGEAATASDLPSAGQVLIFATKRERAHSRKCPELRSLCSVVRGLLAAGSSVDEITLEARTASYRYRRGDCLKSLRVVHRMYTEETRLNLIAGIWYLCPINGVQNCTRYSCQDRLVCGRTKA